LIVSLHYNGSVSVELKPETDIERAYIKVMLESSKSGRTVTLQDTPEGLAVVVPK
jgi:hypothetical protein